MHVWSCEWKWGNVGLNYRSPEWTCSEKATPPIKNVLLVLAVKVTLVCAAVKSFFCHCTRNQCAGIVRHNPAIYLWLLCYIYGCCALYFLTRQHNVHITSVLGFDPCTHAYAVCLQLRQNMQRVDKIMFCKQTQLHYPEGPLTLLYHPPLRRRTRCRVDSFWIL